MTSSSATVDNITASLSAIKLRTAISPPAYQTARSTLERLPLEVRQQIYRCLFNRHDPTELSVYVRIRYRRITQALESSALRTLWILMWTSRQISVEARAYFFAFYRFNLIPVHDKQGYLGLLTTLWQQIGAHNLCLIRKLALPLYSIRLFDEDNSVMEQSRLWFASNLLAKFPALTHLDLGLHALECLPRDHTIFSRTPPTAQEMSDMEQWEWSGMEANIPLRECFEEVGRALPGKNVEVGIYWSDLIYPKLLARLHNQQTCQQLESVYKERLLVVLQKWLKAKSVQSRGSLRGFRHVYDHHTHKYVIKDDYA